ncbi:MAG: MOSC domain-containing protein, partial [Hyphomicrobiales bacterium]
AWAIEAGTKKFDTFAPKYFPKTNFLMLMRDERLAALETEFDDTTGVLTIKREGKQVATGNLNEKLGRQLVEQFFAAYLPDVSRGAPKVVRAEGWNFTDVPAKFVSIINLATVRDIERVAGKPVDATRFRGNILIDGIDPWEEFNWLDKTLYIEGEPVIEVRERTRRCAATNVNPHTAQRDMTLPRLLSDAFGHMDCGIYVSVIKDCDIKPGDTLSVQE